MMPLIEGSDTHRAAPANAADMRNHAGVWSKFGALIIAEITNVCSDTDKPIDAILSI
jgi:hypothetical protein